MTRTRRFRRGTARPPPPHPSRSHLSNISRAPPGGAALSAQAHLRARPRRPAVGTNVIAAISIHEPTGARARRPSISAFGLTTPCRRAAAGPHAVHRSPTSLREARLRRAASSRRYQQRSALVACLGRRTGGALPTSAVGRITIGTSSATGLERRQSTAGCAERYAPSAPLISPATALAAWLADLRIVGAPGARPTDIGTIMSARPADGLAPRVRHHSVTNDPPTSS